jgi:hypothetical protein
MVGIEADWHVELEIRGDLDAQGRSCAEGDEPGGRVDRPARQLLDARI